MSAPRPLEEQILLPAVRVLEGVSHSAQAQVEVLEGAASRLGGFSLTAYRKHFEPSNVLTVAQAMEGSELLLRALQGCAIPAPIALCALARPRLSHSQQRTSGAYYTDFRLAQYVADAAGEHLIAGARVIDPAAGSGILLVAASLAACGADRCHRSKWLAENITAWDLSREALRGARLALAALTDDLGAVQTMLGRWRCHDSLFAEGIEWGAFDVVIGNPPWEKIKLTRHEFLKANGGSRHYGEEYGSMDHDSFAARRLDVARYGNMLAERYPLLGNGEPDLYKAFIELFTKLARPDGCISILVPAGLIRSQGCEDLRQFLFENAGELSFTILENRARFFAIDTRFKFLRLTFTKASARNRRHELRVLHARGAGSGVDEVARARLSRKVLSAIRGDLTVPEVRSEHEWRLFRTMSERAGKARLKDSPWHTEIVREVDMTRDRKNFVHTDDAGHLPLIEGRMVHQHRFGAKAYRYGRGRRAKWETVPLGHREINPQFWYPQERLSRNVQNRAGSLRAGFCDITGQTNERSMLAALVPPGVLCGNKVPTVTFPNDPRDSRLFLWLAIVNSFPFDWALRRTVTTTVNYFVLRGVPLPRLEPDSLPGQRIVKAARNLHDIDAGKVAVDPWQIAHLRASIDIAIHVAYGLLFEDLEVMLRDFPLLDRGQPSLPGEDRSTITRDFVLSRAAVRFKVGEVEYTARYRMARDMGAVPYVPSEFALADVVDGAEVSDA